MEHDKTTCPHPKVDRIETVTGDRFDCPLCMYDELFDLEDKLHHTKGSLNIVKGCLQLVWLEMDTDAAKQALSPSVIDLVRTVLACINGLPNAVQVVTKDDLSADGKPMWNGKPVEDYDIGKLITSIVKGSEL